MDETFSILPPTGPPAPVVVHVPHAGTRIPADVRDGFTLDDAALAAEMLHLTDHRTDVLAAGTRMVGATMFVNRCSRLVVDPERFPDDAVEEMATRGMGAVYTHGAYRELLRELAPGVRDRLLDRYFHPYAAAFAELVTGHLDAHGACTIVDVHSYPTRRLPYELHDGPRPPLCIGTDARHTPRWLHELVADRAAAHGLATDDDTPFAGTYVPLDRYGTDARVTSVMLELRRDTHLDELTGQLHGGGAAVTAFVTDVVAAVAAHHRDRRRRSGPGPGPQGAALQRDEAE